VLKFFPQLGNVIQLYQHISETSQNIISATAAEVVWYRSLSHQSAHISCSYKPFVQSTSAVMLTTMCSTVALLGLSVICGLVSGSALNRQQWSKSYLRISARCECSLLISSSELWCTQFSTKSYKHIFFFKFIFISVLTLL